jgi:predicted nucleic acid-binding protein
VTRPKVYVETTVVSYLVALPTEDIIQMAHQEITRQWWERRDRFDLYVSRAVVAEARRGNPDAAARRLDALRGIPRLARRSRVLDVARTLVRRGTLPAQAGMDAAHVGIAAVHGMEYLVTWNLRHLANATIRGKIEEVVRAAGMVPPIICTPEELMEPKP